MLIFVCYLINLIFGVTFIYVLLNGRKINADVSVVPCKINASIIVEFSQGRILPWSDCVLK